MSFEYGPSIVKSGLVLCLDAGDRNSYTGTGQGTSTWFDVSGNNNNFTVSIEVGGTAWNSRGFFELNESTRTFTYNSAITTNTTCTMVFWLRTNDVTAGLLMRGQSGNEYVGAFTNTQNFYNNNCGTPTYTIDMTFVANPINPSTFYTDNRWHMWEAKSVNLSTWTGYGFNNYGSPFGFSAGAIAAIHIYNRNLTAAESLQNYTVFKSRFR